MQPVPCRRFDYYIPRMYRRNARKDYLNLARCKKRTRKKIRKAIRQQLQYIRRDRKYINELLETECELTQKTKVMFSSQLLSGISKERVIIRNASWQIKSTGTETTLPIAGSTESAYQGRLWEDYRKMPQLTERRNTKTMLSESQWKEHLPLRNKNTDSV